MNLTVKMKRLIPLVVLMLFHLPLKAQKYSQEEAVEDLRTLQKNIIEYNPALSHYHPNFKKLSDQVINDISQDSLSLIEHFTGISKICALSHEGHFSVGSWKDTVHSGIVKNRYAYLPITVQYISGKLYVRDNFSNEQVLKRGDQITAINGTSTDAIMERLIAVTPFDGDIKSYGYQRIARGFPWLLYFHFSQADSLDIDYLNTENSQKAVTIKTLLRSEQVANYNQLHGQFDNTETKERQGFYQLDLENNYAVLTLSSFDYRKVNEYKVKSKKMYRHIFSVLDEKKVNNLIIDLRGNTGGRNEFADDMVSYIMQSASSDPFLKKTISWNGKERTYHLPKPSKLAFKGSIYLLVDNFTYSAGNTLARYIKEYGNATVIGEETGTRYAGFAAGSKQTIILPNSKMVIGIPRYHILFPNSEKQKTPNRGLIPDYPIQPFVENLTNQEDLYLKKTFELINQ